MGSLLRNRFITCMPACAVASVAPPAITTVRLPSTVTARGTALRNGDGSTLRFGIVREGQSCSTTLEGSETSFSGLEDGEEYGFVMCVESWSGDQSFGRAETTESVRAQQSGRAPQNWTFVVDATPNVNGQRADWVIRQTPTSPERVPNNNVVEFRGGPPTNVVGQNPNIQVRYVHRFWDTATPWADVTPRAGSAPYQVQANWRVDRCIGGSDLIAAGDSSGGAAAFGFGNAGLVFYDKNDHVLTRTPDTWAVPVGAVRVEGITMTVNWDAQGWGLAPVSATFGADCDPNTPGQP